MTSIISNPYVAQYSNTNLSLGGNAARVNPQITHQKPETTAVKVTLSKDAQATLSEKNNSDNKTVTEDARTNLTKLLEAVKRTSPLVGGKLVVDLSGIKRSELFAIAKNADTKFTDDEQKAAKLELQRRFDEALASSHSVLRVTGDYKDLYKSAHEYMDSMSAEEKKTDQWKAEYTALETALNLVDSKPGVRPEDIKNDPVSDYLKRAEKGEVAKKRDIADVALDARNMLDKVYEKSGGLKNLSQLNNRSLSAIASNSSDKFTDDEISRAKTELKSRLGKDVQSAFQSSATSGDTTAFTKKLMAQYSSMSAEERKIAGFDKNYYQALVQNYESSLKISQAFSGFSQGLQTPSLVHFL